MTMTSLKLFAQRYKFIWPLYLIVTLIGVQCLNVHLDVYDHQHLSDEIITSDHASHNATHICGGTCDATHNHEEVTELDISPDGVIKNVSFGSLILALFASIITIFLIQRTFTRLFWHRDINTLPWWQVALRPPLRAPPL